MNIDRKDSNGSSRHAVSLHVDEWGRLVLVDLDGIRHVGVEPVRGFPITDPAHGISLCDAHGREVLWIEDPAELPVDVRRVLEHELSRREFMPVIRKIVRVSAHTEPSEWDVETDRGRTVFLLNSEDDVRRLEGHRAMIVDAHGIRYLISDMLKLDTASRHVLERYL